MKGSILVIVICRRRIVLFIFSPSLLFLRRSIFPATTCYLVMSKPKRYKLSILFSTTAEIFARYDNAYDNL